MGHIAFAITDHVTNQLAQLLGRDIAHIHVEERRADLPAALHIVALVDRRQIHMRLVIKAEEDQSALCLYTHYLEPFDLNSPHYYGYITVDGRPFLVMEHVHHTPPNWHDAQGYLRAVDWLIKSVMRGRRQSNRRKLTGSWPVLCVCSGKAWVNWPSSLFHAVALSV